DSVGGARTGDCEQCRSGAEEKALDVHFLTSSQKFKNGSGYFLLKDSVPCPIPMLKKMRCAPLLRDRHYPSGGPVQ
ncbi:hypothetical protein, partial [Mesorhizobium sp. NBIMC_P2-C1]|uniref:hypothetical protein n=1 Tax=Mesorhizobium sp. NBIMC_P2-C1 TaxID=1320555 RepID=UPI0019553169